MNNFTLNAATHECKSSCANSSCSMYSAQQSNGNPRQEVHQKRETWPAIRKSSLSSNIDVHPRVFKHML
ncbi:hypothetical protein PRIPAC_79363 [Pristionchus pacificus]|uniref:Uncharacterized protein n=1 Tax=Pristionchus pacificus TaxID=54126 RepID=A0A2A6BYD8_PRIPA|nr:hypothetical protein PRIPAC_79363 [Pristionchus pacificus]|eukprot:PDM70781.1 hypothetical protein PRIPAC_44985 [Pristionchus pacificus]